MKPEDKIPSLELCRKLWESGITKDIETERVWFRSENSKRYSLEDCCPYQSNGIYIFPAPDLAEMGELLPEYFTTGKTETEYYCDVCFKIPAQFANTEANARAKILIRLKEPNVTRKL